MLSEEFEAGILWYLLSAGVRSFLLQLLLFLKSLNYRDFHICTCFKCLYNFSLWAFVLHSVIMRRFLNINHDFSWYGVVQTVLLAQRLLANIWYSICCTCRFNMLLPKPFTHCTGHSISSSLCHYLCLIAFIRFHLLDLTILGITILLQSDHPLLLSDLLNWCYRSFYS